MDSVALITALMAASVAQAQYAVAATIAKSQPDAGNAVSILTAAANSNADKLANAARGLGQNIDISV